MGRWPGSDEIPCIFPCYREFYGGDEFAPDWPHKDSYYGFESEVRAIAFPPAVDELGRADFLANRFESESDPGLQVFAPAVHPARLIKGWCCILKPVPPSKPR